MTPQEKALGKKNAGDLAVATHYFKGKATHKHSHNKRGLVGVLEGLKNTKHFGEMKGARKARKQNEKKQGHELF